MHAYILREKFLEFFKSKKHKIVESDSLAPADDPTVLFTPAGMNQFKKEFLGFESGFKRAATAQRCLRTDDLDKVGKTSGHHTFFEMLGNFSFGDYFKDEAITYAWEFLTEELKIDNDKLWVSVYKEDGQAYKIWREKIKVPEGKIIKLGDKENFWPSEAKTKGPNGPCGPCSEIFYDWGKDVGCAKPNCTPACSCGRFVEVWNLVFTQFNRKEGGALEPLPNKNIDTGMGLERLAAIMQGVKNNFETDLFQPIIKEIINCVAGSPDKQQIYPVADHIRAIVFAIYDGVLPSNEGRGYVVRKLIRKATLHLRSGGAKQPFLYKLAPVVADIMHPYYPELAERKENISSIILAEERNFTNTLNSSETLFNDKFKALMGKPDAKKTGKIAFELYDTYGMPLEITLDWLKEKGLPVSQEEFNKQMQEQKERSKLQSKMKGDVFSGKEVDYGVTKSKFLGYKEHSSKAKILKIFSQNAEVKKIGKGQEAIIILDKTPFYAEQGGQVGDTGQLSKGKNIFTVSDTRKQADVIIHVGKVKEGSFKKTDMVTAVIDRERRLAIARNHTATHMLQAALRKVLGAHIKQQGSLVAEDRLRFDFTHFKNINKEELERIEEIVNSNIMSDILLDHKEMPLAQAKKSGALAFFGEKYARKVRVVSIEGLSKELCGGTHLNSTGQIGLFKITREGSVASGIRRIEALTGLNAYKAMKKDEDILKDVSGILNVEKDKLSLSLEANLRRLTLLEKELYAKKLERAQSSLDDLLKDAQVINGVNVITNETDNLNMDMLRKNMDLLKNKAQNSVIALGSGSADKAFLVVGITQDLLAKGWDAVQLVREASGAIGGSGGGRKDFAQAGGNNPKELKTALDAIKEAVKRKI